MPTTMNSDAGPKNWAPFDAVKPELVMAPTLTASAFTSPKPTTWVPMRPSNRPAFIGLKPFPHLPVALNTQSSAWVLMKPSSNLPSPPPTGLIRSETLERIAGHPLA